MCMLKLLKLKTGLIMRKKKWYLDLAQAITPGIRNLRNIFTPDVKAKESGNAMNVYAHFCTECQNLKQNTCIRNVIEYGCTLRLRRKNILLFIHIKVSRYEWNFLAFVFFYAYIWNRRNYQRKSRNLTK